MILIKNIFDFLSQKSYRTLTVLALVMIFTGTMTYHFVEGWRWLDSLYFSVITLTTVGYGDFSPQTDFGKVFSIFYILTGIGIILGFINTIYQHRITKIEKTRQKRTGNKGL